MRRRITCVLYAAVAALLALITMGVTGPSTAGAATATAGAIGIRYDPGQAGYITSGRWFRFAATTLTVPARTLPSANGGSAVLELRQGAGIGPPYAEIVVSPGGGPASIVVEAAPGGSKTLQLSPQVGDQLAVSIYYDRKGHDYFTVSDLTQHTTQTVRITLSFTTFVYDTVRLGSWVKAVDPPQADTRLWKFADTRLTTYTGKHGTVLGPWTTTQIIATTTGTSAGTVKLSPSGLWNGGANFGVWLRALPVTYTTGLAGYTDSVGRFRYVATTMTVPPARTPPANGGSALVTLGHNGGPTPRPYANIQVLPGGGAGSISYDSNAAHGPFTVAPKPGDQLRVSIFYDQNGHYSFTVTDTTRGTTQQVTAAAPYASDMPLNSAAVAAALDNSAVIPPPADTQIWQFAGSKVTTYSGEHGSMLGPWATTQWTDTIDGTHAGAVVADASPLSNGGQDFGVWLRHH